MSKRRMRALAILLGVCALISINPSRNDLNALPPADVERLYYSDSTYTVDVGWYWLSCTGYIEREGTATKYYKEWKSPCENGGVTCRTYICTGMSNGQPTGCSVYYYGC